jgi:LuxR family maltose regulon positive regulatory protein
MVSRSRLHREIDRAIAPVLWICAPAGTGKTLGAAGYLDARAPAGIWYEVDADDRDPGTLVVQLATRLQGMRADRRSPRVQLPLVPVEFLRRQAEVLFGGILLARRDRRTPLVLVLDNYQEAGGSPPWNELVAGLAVAWAGHAPPKSRILVTSRHRPPEQLAKLVASGQIAEISADLLRFDDAELRVLLRARTALSKSAGRGRTKTNADEVRRLAQVSQGWAVAAVLLARTDTAQAPSSPGMADRDAQAFFDYLSAEVARRLSPDTRRALSQLAFVHDITGPVLAILAPAVPFPTLAGELTAAALPFSEDGDGTIRLHDLVRAFLRERMFPTLADGERARILSSSARILADDGHLQEAAAVCRQAEAWDDLTVLVCLHAPALIGQGRAATVAVALQALPLERIDGNPWLGLWRAMCGLPGDPPAAERRLVALVQQFRDTGEEFGRQLAAACALQAIVIGGNDLQASRPLLEVLDEPLTIPLPPPIQAQVRASRLMALTFLEQGSPRSQRAADEALALPADPNQPGDAIIACGLAMTVYGTAGRIEDGEAARATARRLARTAPHDPLAQLAYLHGEAWFHAADGNYARGVQVAEEGITLAESGGIMAWRGNMAVLGCLNGWLHGDEPKMRGFLSKVEEALNLQPSNYLRGAFLYSRACYKLLLGQIDATLSDLRATRGPARACGFPMGIVAACLTEMIVLASCGRFAGLEDPRRALAEVCATFNPPIVEGTKGLVEALAELLAHGLSAARQTLIRALARAREVRLILVPVAGDRLWPALAAAAFELDIETAYVESVVRRYRIAPPADDTGPFWPWPVVVRTLGPFSLAMEGRPSSSRPPAGPLRMLKAMVAAGGAPVRRERLIAELWPGQQAGHARAVFDTTLHRLRRTLGDDSLVRFEDGEISLDKRRIWCDAWALVHLHKKVRSAAPGLSVEELDRLERRLRGLHQGPFCSDEQEHFMHRPRTQLAHTFAECASTLADLWLEVGQAKRAVALLEAAIESDDLNEPLYAKLIGVHVQTGAVAAAAHLYKRCLQVLRTRLGVQPSPQTQRALPDSR